jgi:predicted polyphosphate/ATP-dependent NAD kinase
VVAVVGPVRAEPVGFLSTRTDLDGMCAKRVGLIVNPIAGMGGRVGLKGTDSPAVLERARELGAEPVSPARAAETLRELADADVDVDVDVDVDADLELLTGPGPMGEEVAESCGFSPVVVGSVDPERTTPADTRAVAEGLVDRGVDLLVFAGGDGTARDVSDAVGDAVPVVGIPAGVKIYSAVFAPTPAAAGQLVAAFLRDETDDAQLREVMDIDEEEFRDDRLSARLHGYLRVPQRPRLVQNPKSRGSDATASKEAIAAEVVDSMEPGRRYVIGPGTTTMAITDRLGLEGTVLGVDVVEDGELVAADVNEAGLLELLEGRDAAIVVGVIGGQGFVFGRGNQQLSGRVVREVGVDNVTIVATESKLLSLDGAPLFVDTGDDEVDEALSGYTRVVTGRGQRMVAEVSH